MTNCAGWPACTRRFAARMVTTGMAALPLVAAMVTVRNGVVADAHRPELEFRTRPAVGSQPGDLARLLLRAHPKLTA